MADVSPDSALRRQVISEIMEQTLRKDYDGVGKAFLSQHPKPPTALVLGPRHEPRRFCAPGPGAYDIMTEDSLRATKHYAGHTIMGRKYFKKTENSRLIVGGGGPGPGAYDCCYPSSKGGGGGSLKGSFGSARKDIRDSTIAPCPGLYSLPSQFSLHPHTGRTTFGAGTRPHASGVRKDKLEMPGPGTYPIPSTFRPTASKACYLTSRFPSDRLASSGPGPATYETQKIMAMAPMPPPPGTAGGRMRGRLPHPLFDSKCSTDVFARMPSSSSKHARNMYKRSCA